MQTLKYSIGDKFKTFDKEVLEVVETDTKGIYTEPYKVKSLTYTEQMSESELDSLTQIQQSK